MHPGRWMVWVGTTKTDPVALMNNFKSPRNAKSWDREMWWTYSEIFSVVWKHTRNISCEVFSPYPDSRAGYISWCSNSCHSHATTNFLVACSHNDILEMIQDFIKDNNKTIKMSMPIILLKLKTPGLLALFICWISSTNPTDEKCNWTSPSYPQSEESWTSCTHTFFL